MSFSDQFLDELDELAAQATKGREHRKRATAEAAAWRQRLRDERIWGVSPDEALQRQARIVQEIETLPSLTETAPASTPTGTWSALYRAACRDFGSDAADLGAQVLIRQARAAFVKQPTGHATLGDLDAIYREAATKDPASRAAEYVATFAHAELLKAQRRVALDEPVLPEARPELDIEALPEAGDGDGGGDAGSDEPLDAQLPEEAEIPHDENTEEMSTIESPHTGEEIVIELGVAEGANMEPEEVERLPYVAQLSAFNDFENAPADEGDGIEALDEGDGGDEGGEAEATTTLMIDPTTDTGELIEVSIKPVGGEAENLPAEEPEAEPGEYEAFMLEDEARGAEPAWRGFANSAVEAWKRAAAALDVPPDAVVRGADHALERSAWLVWNDGRSKLNVVAVPVSERQARRKASQQTPAKPTRKALLQQASEAGMTAQAIEDRLLRGDVLSGAGASLTLVGDFDVALTVAGRQRRASLSNARELIEQYIVAQQGVNWSQRNQEQRREATLAEAFGGTVSAQALVETDCYSCGRRSAWLSVADEFPCDCGYVVHKSEAESQIRARRHAGLDSLWVLQADLPKADADTSRVRAARIAKTIQALAPKAKAQYRVAQRRVVAEVRATEESAHRILQELMGRYGLERTAMMLDEPQNGRREAQLDEPVLETPAAEAPVAVEASIAAPAPAPVAPAAPQGILHERDRERIQDAARYFRSNKGLSRVEVLGQLLGGANDVGSQALDAISREVDDPLRAQAGEEIEAIVSEVYAKPIVPASTNPMVGMFPAAQPAAAPPAPEPLPEMPAEAAPEAVESDEIE